MFLLKHPRLLILPLLSYLFITNISAAEKVLQVQVVHRHGARPSLSKNPFNTSEDGRRSARLYPQGETQLTNLGAHIRKTYIEDNLIDGISEDDPSNVFARSSNFYRTLMSSQAFLKGLYPDNPFLTALVFNNERNDWRIRGYTLCPTLDQRFDEFRQSDDFKKKQSEIPEGESETNEDFVVNLAKNFDDFKDDEELASFYNVWSVYDRYLIIANNGYGEPEDLNQDDSPLANVSPISPEQLERLRNLAHWHETHKFDYGIHNIHLAGGLLQRIMSEAQKRIDGEESASRHPIYEYSAHYPTLLTLLASLRARNTERLQFPADKIPGFGAAILFELVLDDDDEYLMRLKWWEGDGSGDENNNDVSFEPFAIGRQPCVDKQKGCKFSEMQRMVALDSFGKETFCNDCESRAPFCSEIREEGGQGGKDNDDVTVENRCATGTKLAAGSIGAGVGLVVGLALALGYFTMRARRKRQGLAMEDQFEAEGDFMG